MKYYYTCVFVFVLMMYYRYAGGMTLTHLICAFGSTEAYQLMQCSPPVPKSNVWSLEDSEGKFISTHPISVLTSEVGTDVR